MEKYKKNDTIKVRCVTAINIWGVSGSVSVINGSGTNFDNIKDLIVLCPCWNELSSNYLMYKITGIGVSAVPIHGTTTDLVNGATSVPVYVAIFPTQTNTNKGLSDITDKEDTFKACPNVTTTQEHFWNFPDGYLETVDGCFGIWTPIQTIQTQTGQISFANYGAGGSFENTKILYQLQYDFYISFRSRKN